MLSSLYTIAVSLAPIVTEFHLPYIVVPIGTSTVDKLSHISVSTDTAVTVPLAVLSAITSVPTSTVIATYICELTVALVTKSYLG
mgnify:CR=1 FL=1